jgi:hypothetical protein
MGAQGPTVLAFAHLASVASRRRAWLASPTCACSPVGPPHRRTAGRVSRAAVPSARSRPHLRPPTPTAPRRWRRRRRRPPPAGRSRPSCARRWSPHTRPARWRWRKHAPTARRCACAAAVARGRPARHTHARCRHKQARRNHGVCGAPPSLALASTSGQGQRAVPRSPRPAAWRMQLSRPSRPPFTRPTRSVGRHGTARPARPPSHVTEAVQGGQKSLHVAAAQRHPSVVRVPVCVCVGGISLLRTRGRGHSHRCLLRHLSLCLSVCVRKRGTGSLRLSVYFFRRCTWVPHCDRVPVRASCLVLCLATLCVCV